jgi:hypothetical protein
MAALANISKQIGAPELRRRAVLLYVIVGLAFFCLVSRLAYLQLFFRRALYLFVREQSRSHQTRRRYARHDL